MCSEVCGEYEIYINYVITDLCNFKAIPPYPVAEHMITGYKSSVGLAGSLNGKKKSITIFHNKGEILRIYERGIAEKKIGKQIYSKTWN